MKYIKTFLKWSGGTLLGIVMVAGGLGGLMLMFNGLDSWMDGDSPSHVSWIWYGIASMAITIGLGGVMAEYADGEDKEPKNYSCDRCNGKFTSDEPSSHILKSSGNVLDICQKCVGLAKFITTDNN